MKSTMRITLITTLLLILCISSVYGAAEKRRVDVKPKITSQSAEHRIALVIGNSNYRIGALRNPANDARAMAAALRQLDFAVDEQINLSYQEMGRAVNRFGKSIRRDSVALFYYAGHGLQVQGSNYLLPIDMEIQDEGEVQFNTINAGQVLAKMEEAKNPVNIVILDACRDNPYARGFKRSSLSRGLAPMDAPVGSFVAYAAAPGKTADDGKGKNGLYTESLVRQIKNPGMRIEDVFKRVRTEVRSKSNGNQVPEERSSLEGDFYFAKGLTVVEAGHKEMDKNWIEDSRTKCRAWNANPVPNETISWSGNCIDGYIAGEGILQWYVDGEPKERYTGNMIAGLMTGKGIYTWANGNKYEGDFIDDGKRTGKGTYYCAGGKIITGDWYNNLPVGQSYNCN